MVNLQRGAAAVPIWKNCEFAVDSDSRFCEKTESRVRFSPGGAQSAGSCSSWRLDCLLQDQVQPAPWRARPECRAHGPRGRVLLHGRQILDHRIGDFRGAGLSADSRGQAACGDGRRSSPAATFVVGADLVPQPVSGGRTAESCVDQRRHGGRWALIGRGTVPAVPPSVFSVSPLSRRDQPLSSGD